jgi:hypothetical protein
MYKLIVIMLALAICGCKQPTKIGDEIEVDIVEVEYDGHSYLVFDGHGVIHNPKCKCYGNKISTSN